MATYEDGDMNDKKHFEANMLDGDKVEDCGKAMLSATSIWEYIEERDKSRDQQIALAARKDQTLKVVQRLVKYGSISDYVAANTLALLTSELDITLQQSLEKGKE